MKQKRFDMIFKAHVLFSRQGGKLSYPNINANIPSLCRSGNPTLKYCFLLPEPWKLRLCIKHQRLLLSDINHKDYSGLFDGGRGKGCSDSEVMTPLYHNPHGQRILRWEFNPETHLSLCWGPNKEEISFQRDLEQSERSSWSDLASRSDRASPPWLQIQACIWPLHWKLKGWEKKTTIHKKHWSSGNICQ